MHQIRTKIPQFALLLPTTHKTHREISRGILKYIHLHGPWTVHIIEGRDREQKLHHLKEWGCTGVIGNLDDRRYVRYFLDEGIPAIMTNLDFEISTFGLSSSRLSYIKCDNFPIGCHAAEYFIERKFRHFAFVGDVNDTSWSEDRRLAFCERIAQNGYYCDSYTKLSGSARKDFSVEQAGLCAWLKKLEQPVAILAATDIRGRQVIDSYLKTSIAIPQECAVLGVDNDELLCETANPQLSSIQMSTEQAGFEAARILDGMMRGRHRNNSQPWIITYGFLHITTRRSTDIMQLSDALVARALDFIRINTNAKVTIYDLVRHLRISRRLLEKRFKATMGRTVYAEMLQVRLEGVQRLLLETGMTVDAIAESCGFSSASHLGSVFRKHFGITLSTFRLKNLMNQAIESL